eukprot:11384959-Alexandrium_andersonii.AAC.1
MDSDPNVAASNQAKGPAFMIPPPAQEPPEHAAGIGTVGSDANGPFNAQRKEETTGLGSGRRDP